MILYLVYEPVFNVTSNLDIETKDIKYIQYRTTHLIDYKTIESPSCDNSTECVDEYIDVELTDEKTQYYCKFIKFSEFNPHNYGQRYDWDRNKHLIGYQPLNNDTSGVLHHVIIYNCHCK